MDPLRLSAHLRLQLVEAAITAALFVATFALLALTVRACLPECTPDAPCIQDEPTGAPWVAGGGL